MRIVQLHSQLTVGASDNPTTWERLWQNDTVYSGLLDTSGAATPFTGGFSSGITFNSWGGSSSYLDTLGQGDAAWVDQQVIIRQGHGLNDVGGTYTFGGLDNSKTYTIKVFGSFGSSGRTLQCSVNGSATQSLDTYNNDSNVMLFSDISPDASNELNLFLNSASGSSAYLTAIQLIENDAANVDPALDTPSPDVSIGSDEVGSIDFGSNFSDANAGDTLTFSIAPDISLRTGWTWNSATGVANYNGTQVVTALEAFTISASDGNGGTDATDVVNITVTAPAFTVTGASTLTPVSKASFTINTSNASASGKTASTPAGALTVTAQDANSMTVSIDPLSLGDQSLNFNTDVVITVDDAGDTDTITVQVQPEVGYTHTQITSVDGIYLDDTDVQIGDWVYGEVGSGDVVIDWATGLFANSTASTLNYQLYRTAWSAEATENIPVAVVNNEPTGAVTITGTAQEGETLTANTGTIADADGLGAFSYQWLSNSIAVSGATSSTYVLQNSDVGNTLAVVVTYVDGASNSESLTSAATATVTPQQLDTEKPVITLLGDPVVEVFLGDAYTDAGANVTDNVDADAVLVAQGSVNVTTLGSYTLTYDYTDAAGNIADTVTRTVNVIPAQIPIVESTSNPLPLEITIIDTYDLSQHVDNPDGAPLSYSVVGGTLPAEVTLNASTGVLTKQYGAIYEAVSGITFNVVRV